MASALVQTRGNSAASWLDFVFSVTYLAWLAVVAAYALNLDQSLVIAGGIAACFCTMLVVASEWRRAVLLLPLVVLMGPIVRVSLWQGVWVNVADAMLIVLVAGKIVDGRGSLIRVVLDRRSALWVPCLVLFLLSWGASISPTASVRCALNWIEMALVYWMTVDWPLEPEDGWRLLDAWCYAVSISCVLTLLKYLQGQPMVSRTETEAVEIAAAIASHRGRVDAYYKAFFFYYDFFWSVALATCIALISIVKRHGIGLKLLWGSSCAICAVTMFVLNNRTAMAAALLCALWVLTGVGKQRGGIFHAIKIGVVLSFVGAMSIGLTLNLGDVIGAQYTAASERLWNLMPFYNRLPIWRNTAKVLVENPIRLIVGFGPGMVEMKSGASDPRVMTMLTNDSDGIMEGAVDNAPLGLLAEYGLFFVLLLSICLLREVRALSIRWLFAREPLAVTLRTLILVAAFMGITQRLDVAKPMLILAQILGLARWLGRRPLVFPQARPRHVG
jgi:hypothetical protein